MKTIRLMTIVLALVIAFSAWTPEVVQAKQANPGVESSVLAAKQQKPKILTVVVIIYNYTGGTMTIRIYGEVRSFTFVAPTRGFNRFVFKAPSGLYTYQLTSTACEGAMVTKTKKLNYNFTLGKWVCKK